jgi:hypothetical protein
MALSAQRRQIEEWCKKDELVMAQAAILFHAAMATDMR